MTLHSFNPGVDADTGSAHYDYKHLVSLDEELLTDVLACKNNDRLDDNSDLSKYSGFVRFPMTGVSQGTQITAAHLRLEVLNAWDGSVPGMLIRAVDEDTPTAPTTYANYGSKVRTTAQTLWDWSGSGDDEFAANDYITVDVTAVLQEVIDRPSWDGSAVVFLLEPNNETAINVSHTTITNNFEETLSDANEPQLSILIETINNLSGEIHRFEPGLDIGDDTLLTDFSDSSKHGWIRGATFVSDAGTDALEFNGTTAFVKLIEEVLVGLDDFSIAFWLKADTTSGGHPVYTKGDYDVTSSSYNVRQSALSMQISVYNYAINYGGQITSSQWDHYAFTYSKVDGISMYRNASTQLPAIEFDSRVTVPTSSNDSYLGRDPTDYFDGRLDSIRVFNRILTTDEITDLASARGYNGLSGAATGILAKTLDTLSLSGEGVTSTEGELLNTITDIGLTSAVAREREADLSQTITIGLDSAITGTGSADFISDITLQFSSEGESLRIGNLSDDAVITLESEGTTALSGALSVTLDDILTVTNNDTVNLNAFLDDITLNAYGAEQVLAAASTVAIVYLSSEARPPILGSLTEILDDVILLQTHNFPPIPDNDNSPLLDSCPSLFVGETDATFCSRT